MRAQETLQKLEHRRILILGDVMLDRYLTGSVSRISPEAPVPVVLQRDSEDRLGGAANVALNVRALGSEPVLCSVLGADEDGAIFQKLLPELGISAAGLVISPERRTTVKTRILGNNQQMLRVDREDTHELSNKEQEALLTKIRVLIEAGEVNAVIFQDYNKGVLTPTLIAAVIDMAKPRGILTAADPKHANFFAYRGVDLFKPNLKEIRDSVPFPVQPTSASLEAASVFLAARLENRLTMITLSEKGLFLGVAGAPGYILPTEPRNIADVSGAGDTVISVATLALSAGIDLISVGILSNLAGGQVCEFPGVVPVRRDILERELEDHYKKIAERSDEPTGAPTRNPGT